MTRTRIKICGFTRAEDLAAAVDAGVDAVGMVFYEHSRRCLDLDAAAALRAHVPALVTAVALFVNPSAEAVRAVIDAVHPDLLQFHGEESPAFCAQFGWPFMKAVRVGAPGCADATQVAAYCARYPQARAWLFDSYSTGYGGSGLSFDEALLDQVDRGPDAPRLVLSGGLDATTVGARIARWRPHAVDVSSAVERAPGVKDAALMRAFVAAVRKADQARS